MIEKLKSFYSKHKRYLFVIGSLIFFVLLGKLLFENTDLILDGIFAIREADKIWVLFGLIVFFVSVPLNALILILLSYKKLPNLLTFKEQMALLFVNKLLPSGLGQLTLNSYYLHKEGNSKPQTASIIATKAMTAGIAFLSMIIFFVVVNLQNILSIFGYINFDEISFFSFFIILLVIIGIILLITKVILKNKKIKSYISKPIINFKKEIIKYKDQPSTLIKSTSLAILATLTGMIALWASSKAIGLDLTYSEVFFIYFFGNLLASVIPIPGGIGTTEVGLYLGFSILGYDPEIFISAILIYRIINYWIPLGIGYFFFLNLRKNILKNFSIKHSNKAITN